MALKAHHHLILPFEGLGLMVFEEMKNSIYYLNFLLIFGFVLNSSKKILSQLWDLAMTKFPFYQHNTGPMLKNKSALSDKKI